VRGRGFGMLLGAGAIAGAAFALSRLARPAAAAPVRSRGFAPRGTFAPLVERWRPEVERRAEDLPVQAILEWIRIESGGDMAPPGGNPREAGIFQLAFPGDAKYGATLEGLRELGRRSAHQDPKDISWLSERDLDMQVGAGIRKILAARATVRRVFAENGVRWLEDSFDFGSAVKQIHSAPAVITELLPKIVRRDREPPASWGDLRARVMSFPVAQMGEGLRKLWGMPSRRGLKNRLEDTLRNAEFVGRAWSVA
jgi:hypothetical protein